MNLKPEEISSVIKEQIERYSTKLEVSDVGTVIQVADALHESTVLRMPCRENFWNFRERFTAWC